MSILFRSCIVAAGLILGGAGAARAQVPDPTPADTLPLGELPREIGEPIIAFFNSPSTIHFTGRTRIPAERVIVGDVAVLGGPLTLAGRVEGRVVVIDGDVDLLPGAVITGGLTVVGGTVGGLADAAVEGGVRTFSERLRYRWRGDRIASDLPRETDAEAEARERPERWLTRSDFLIATGRSYNRVEGLPIAFGPVLETGGSNPTWLRAQAIYRTESGATLDPERLGYYLRGEQFVGGRGHVRVGGTLHSVIDPIEDWQVLNLENSLSTFLLHRDLRDHYEREGWSAFAAWDPPRTPWDLGLTLRAERHASAPTGSPWALFRNQETWRAQPLVAEGRLTSLSLDGRWDTRNSPSDPSHGWHISGQVEHALRSDLARPEGVVVEALPIVDPIRLVAEPFDRWTRGRLDIRRYNRLSPDSRLNLRLLVGGSLDGSRLPPQRQHALGGEGSLPGYSLFGLDCGARAQPVYAAGAISAPVTTTRDAPPVFVPGYGCDQAALFQAEYRGKLSLRFGWGGSAWGEGDGRGWDLGWAASPDWVAFVDAARGWGIGRGDEDLALDLGFGILFHRVGVYLATPLTGEGRVNLFVRLGPRF